MSGDCLRDISHIFIVSSPLGSLPAPKLPPESLPITPLTF